MAVGFWEMFFDSDYRQREDINELRVALATTTDTSQLQRSVGTLQMKVRSLETLVTVLVKMLEDAGQLDAKVLRYRVEAEIEAQEALRREAGVMSMGEAFQSHAQAAAPVETPPPTTPTLCARCGQTVPQNQTTITATGTICDRCAAG
jgi:hypothetical protein